MPIYEYRCEQCGAVTELIQKVSDPPLTKCDKCGGKMVKLLAAPAIQFKGSGFYITDYTRKGDKGDKGEKKEGGDKPASESGKKTEPTKTESPKSDSGNKKD